MTKEYRGYKYRIETSPDGRYYFEMWRPGVDTRAPGESWGAHNTEADAERAVKRYIDDHEAGERRR